MATSEPVTPLELVKLAAGYFAQKGIENPRLDAEILLAHVLGVQRIGLYLQFDKPLKNEEVGGYRELVRRRGMGEPAAYIIGVREFWSLPFRVAPGVLIPRPDTETLVEEALKRPDGDCAVAEIGVGSGAVIISLLKERPTWRGVACDLSPDALKIAGANAREHGVEGRLELLLGDLTAPFAGKKFSLLVTNPPYIPTEEIGTLSREVRGHEPALALDGGPDGLDIFRRLADEVPALLLPGGEFLTEFGLGQGESVLELLEKSGGLSEIRLINDLTGRPRVAGGIKGV